MGREIHGQMSGWWVDWYVCVDGWIDELLYQFDGEVDGRRQKDRAAGFKIDLKGDVSFNSVLCLLLL